MKICNKVIKIIQLIKILNNYLLRAAESTKNEFSFLY